MHQFIRQIRFRKKVATYLIISFSLLIAAGFFYVTASETWSMGIEKLGEERYTSRMNDSFLYAALLSLMALPLVLSLNPFFKNYIESVKTLSKSEMERLQREKAAS